MDIWQVDKLALFLIFFIPGFISIKIYDLLVPGEKRDFTKSLFEVIGYSALNFAAFSWLIIIIHAKELYDLQPKLYFMVLFLILFIAPILWPIIVLRLLTWKPIAKFVIHPIQKPWDYIFGKKESFWMIVHLKDGRKIGGRYDTNSFASSYPADEQIYLEEVWKLDEKGKFIETIDRTKGILILSKDISSIELFQ